ncbi:MAG: phosphoribosyltransferase regulatory subunit [Thermoleophilaceae bacterium]|jgi:ATP phosphoribosyltransferase regulatory subunit|nr:phosphoribosyltransferase regulatory subunit [Thermoleophilaceae bacterium]
MIHPIPPGTRDVLPDEMRELRALSARLRERFEAAGYGEVRTPALEYEEVLRRGDDRAASAPFRLFDEHGRVLVLRSDMTIPIARLVASRYADAEPPLRFCYFQHAYRAPERGRTSAEFLQGGIELIGAPGPAGEVEVLALAAESLEAIGLRRYRVGVGDGALYRTLLAELEVAEEDREPLLRLLSERRFVELEAHVGRLAIGASARSLLTELPRVRGGAEVLERGAGPAAAAVEGLRELHAGLEERGIADRVIFDLGLVRELDYYTGAVFEVYDPAVGFALGGGGRYDGLLARFGRDLPACGLALDIQAVHTAQAAEERC